jgi:hypothetical protein
VRFWNWKAVNPAFLASIVFRLRVRAKQSGQKMTVTHLGQQNAETIHRLVEQGEFLLKTFHAEYKKDPAGDETEFLRGNVAGWRSTLHTLYHDGAEEIVDRVLANTSLAIPDSQNRVGSAVTEKGIHATAAIAGQL